VNEGSAMASSTSGAQGEGRGEGGARGTKPPAIDVKRLHFAYTDGTRAVADVSFGIQEGETVALIGPNGAGKSTLLHHLNGILPETLAAPAVWVFGSPVVPNNLEHIRRTVGLLFQDPDDQLFCPTVFEDVSFGPQQFAMKGADLKQRVAESLAKVGLTGFEGRSPHRLSTGEKRRVCLAGVLACEPKILALDEPTAGLDPRGRRELKALLHHLPATKIIATHDLDLVAELCPRTIVLDQGMVVADGVTRDILSDEPLMLRHGLETPASLRVSRL
jgi:energy-coupling factor transporter ATP-binding protein EcfA2